MLRNELCENHIIPSSGGREDDGNVRLFRKAVSFLDAVMHLMSISEGSPIDRASP